MRRRTGFRRILVSQLKDDEAGENLIARGEPSLIRDYSLVLASQRIEHRISKEEQGPYRISTPEKSAQNAQEQIRLYREENPPRTNSPPLSVHLSLSPLFVLALPTALTLLEFSDSGSKLYFSGIADAEKILGGDWWRPVTALTLHADAHHLASNLVSGFVALTLLAFRLPLCRIVFPLAVASAIANFLVALTVQHNFRSLGFSTFVFAAIGALGAIEFRLMPREFHGLLRRFAPLFSAILLAVFLGLGEHSDILAHLYGFVLGIFCGWIPRKSSLLFRKQANIFDILLWVLFFAIFAVAWCRAIFYL